MKKYILLLLSIVICSSTMNLANAKTSTTSPDLAAAIRLYKAGNYSQCYTSLNKIIKKDSTNALAYYYMAMTSAQIGKKEDAITNYEKAISLAGDNDIGRYAQKGKICLEEPDKCHDEAYTPSELDLFIKRKFGSGFSEQARSEYEKQKIENMMREMNRGKDIAPTEFKDYKDFSSMNNTPSNDEIVAALRVLQNAGFGNLLNNNNNMSDLSLLTGGQNNNNAMLNMLLGGNSANGSMNPQVIQALLTNQLSTGF